MLISTGLRNHLLATGSLKGALDGGFIRVYAGAVPSSADDSVAGNTLLCTITESDDGLTGLTLDSTPTGGIVQKATGETWSGTPVATGVATFWRYSGTADAGGLSTTEKRAQGTIGVVLADMIVANTTFTNGVLRQIDNAAFGLPAS